MAVDDPPAMPADSLADYNPDSPFQCCVCLDLLYKPIVLACGHISCFWCVHQAMHGFRESHCALCRHPYNHFPSICMLLHALLLKLEPVACKRREMEVLEEEKHRDVFSPQFLDPKIEERPNLDNGQKETSVQVSIDDVLCSLCKELLYQPVVLNCGHVYCESCLSGVDAEPIKCHACQSLHPGEFPNVCLDLDHFLEVQFPREYEQRRQEVLLKQGQCQSSGSFCSKDQDDKKQSDKVTKKKQFGKVTEEHPGSIEPANIHFGVGCDYCGMYPIAGKRYRCKDCKEAIGFDLCEACYNTKSKLPGRFNQQHTPDHQFELDDSQMIDGVFQLGAIFVDELQQRLSEEVLMLPDEPDDQDNEDEDFME